MATKAGNDRMWWSLFSVLFGFALFIALLGFFWILRGWLAPVFVGLLLAFIFHPVVDWTRLRWHWSPLLTVTLLLISFAALVTGLAVWLLPLAFVQISQFMQNLPVYIEELARLVSGKEIELGEELTARFSEFAGKPEEILPLVVSGSVKSLGIFADVFSAATYILIYMVLLFVFFVAFSLHLQDIGNWFGGFFPKSKKDEIFKTLRKIYGAAGAFLRTRLVVALIMGILFSLGWALAGVPYWLLLGMASGFLSIIPYAAALGWLVVLLINGLESANLNALIYALLWPSVVYVVVQLFEGWFLTPYLQGEKLKIHPVIVLFAVLAGGTLAGLLGVFLAIPFTAAWQIIFADLIKPRLLRWANTH